MPDPDHPPIEDPGWPSDQYRDKARIDPIPLVDLNPAIPDADCPLIDTMINGRVYSKDGDASIKGFYEWRLGNPITEGVDFLEDQDIKYPTEDL